MQVENIHLIPERFANPHCGLERADKHRNRLYVNRLKYSTRGSLPTRFTSFLEQLSAHFQLVHCWFQLLFASLTEKKKIYIYIYIYTVYIKVACNETNKY